MLDFIAGLLTALVGLAAMALFAFIAYGILASFT